MSAKAAATRLNILQKAFALVYQNGYRTTSVDEIIATTKVTKGAFFYHFKNKDEMGIAMIREVMYEGMLSALTQPLEAADDPVAELYTMMHGLLMENTFFVVKYGCPAINLIDEMASQNNDFRTVLLFLSDAWKKAIVDCLEKGKANGKVSAEADSNAIAFYVMSAYGGIRNLGKIYGKDCYVPFLQEFKKMVETLR